MQRVIYYKDMKRPRNIDPNDKRSAMRRLLEDGQTNGYIWVCYSAQWPTLFKAQRLGYLDDHSYLTPKGKAFLEASHG